jgi:hypothetical protein
MRLSPVSERQIAQQRTEANFPCLIKITHPNYPAGWFYTNASESITYKGDIYNTAVFSIQPPSRDGSKIGDASLTMSAIDLVWIERIRETRIPAKIEFVAVIVYEEGSVAGIEPLEENSFTLRMANWNEISITWAMRFDENMAVIITSVKCNAQITPGCT